MYVPTGMAFLKPGHKCVPDIPFRDIGTSRSKPGLSRSNRDVWSPWPSAINAGFLQDAYENENDVVSNAVWTGVD